MVVPLVILHFIDGIFPYKHHLFLGFAHVGTGLPWLKASCLIDGICGEAQRTQINGFRENPTISHGFNGLIGGWFPILGKLHRNF